MSKKAYWCPMVFLLIKPLALFSALISLAHSAPYAEGPLLDIIRGMPEGTWKKVNLNSFSEVWTPSDLRPLKQSSNPTPDKIILAWSSFAWDSKRGDLILYGGGHANYSGNDVYRWRSRSLKWERAALPSEITLFPGVALPIDGADSAPPSAHTYDNAVYLPIVDRYLNFGGAVYTGGGPYTRPSENDPTLMRHTGPYLFDPSKASPDKVGGTTGSHVKRVNPFPDIEGGEMWQNRDLPKNIPDRYSLRSHINGCTAYSPESDLYDVVYVASRRGGGTGLSLHRYQITDIHNPALDQYELMGVFWSSPSAQTSCGYDPVRKVFLKSGTNTKPFQFWDLRPERTTNRDQQVAMTGTTGTAFISWIESYTTATGISLPSCGLDFDPNRNNFLLWCGGQEVWRITHPETLSVNGWHFAMEPLGTGESPPLNVGTGILGKWEYIPGFDVFIGLENAVNGNIWLYKPIGWVDPGSGNGGGSNNLPPQISLISPHSGENVPLGTAVTITAQASDSDGTVSSVRFKVNGNVIEELLSEPYSITWNATETGSYSVTAEAIDNLGAAGLSEAISFNIVSDGGNGGGGSVATTVVLQRSDNNPLDAADTYLSIYHKNNNFGGSQQLLLERQNYVPLIRFRIFASEGGPVPDGAVIESAILSVYKELYNHVIALHAMLIPWAEKEATWHKATRDSAWNSAGAGSAGLDYEPTPDAVASASWNPGWVDFDVTGRLNMMADNPAENYGWRFVSISGNNNLKKFHTSEKSPEVYLHPKLEIRWRMP